MIPQACRLILKNEKIQWEYPILGIVDSLNKDQQFHFKTQSRVLYKTLIKLSLPGQIPEKNATYTMTIDKIPPEFEKAVNRSLIISDVRNSLKTNDDQIVYNIKF